MLHPAPTPWSLEASGAAYADVRGMYGQTAEARSTRPLFSGRSGINRPRVLIVTPQPFYEDRGTPIAVRYVARALSELGVDVDLLAFPVGRTISIGRMTLFRCANLLGLKRVPIGLSWRKLVLDVSLWRSFRRLLAERHYDMVHAVEEAAYMALALCPRHKQPFIYDMASVIPAALEHNRLLNFAIFRRIFRAIEDRVFRGASRIVCSAGLASYVREHHDSASVDEWRFPSHSGAVASNDVARLRADLNIRPEQRVLLYCGNFAGYQGIELLVTAVARARLTRPELLLVCVGATEPELAASFPDAGDRHTDQLRVVRRQPQDRILVYTAMADALMLPRIGADNIPLKLYDYMASGKPIVAIRQDGHDALLTDQRAFLCEGTVASMAEAIVRVCERPEEAAQVGSAALRYAQQHFGWGTFVEFIRDVYRTTIDRDQHDKVG